MGEKFFLVFFILSFSELIYFQVHIVTSITISETLLYL